MTPSDQAASADSAGGDLGGGGSWLARPALATGRLQDTGLIILVGLTACLLALSVVAGRLHQSAASWSQDLDTVAVTWLAMWGIGVAVRERPGTPPGDLLDARLAAPERLLMERIRMAAILLLFAALFLGGCFYVRLTFGDTILIGAVTVPFWVLVGAVPVGSLIGIVNVVGALAAGPSPAADPDGASAP